MLKGVATTGYTGYMYPPLFIFVPPILCTRGYKGRPESKGKGSESHNLMWPFILTMLLKQCNVFTKVAYRYLLLGKLQVQFGLLPVIS